MYELRKEGETRGERGAVARRKDSEAREREREREPAWPWLPAGCVGVCVLRVC